MGGRKLAEIDKGVIDLERERYPKKKGCCHEIMTEVLQPHCCISILQTIISFGYWCGLPFGVQILRLHKHEHIGEKKLLGQPVRVAGSDMETLLGKPSKEVPVNQ